MPNIIKWFEIPAKDFNRAVGFYRAILGIQVDIFDFNNIAHGVFRLPEEMNNKVGGAIVEQKDMSEHHTGTVLFFDANPDMHRVMERITANGGKVLKPKTLIKNPRNEGGIAIIPKNLIDSNVGYFSYFSDSEGNKMGLYSNS